MTSSVGRRLLIPAVSTAVMLAILLSLGVWQLQRREWKHQLVAQIDSAEALPAIPLAADPQAFAKVWVEGRLRPDLSSIYGAEVRGAVLGGHLIVPLERAGQPALMVDLGWVPQLRDPARPLVLSQGRVEGFVRPAEHAGRFSAADDVAQRQFYTLDPEVIGHALGLTEVMPMALVAIGPSQPGVYPEPASALPRPSDNHLQYAVTWFGFALTLVIIFLLYVRKALRA